MSIEIRAAGSVEAGPDIGPDGVRIFGLARQRAHIYFTYQIASLRKLNSRPHNLPCRLTTLPVGFDRGRTEPLNMPLDPQDPGYWTEVLQFTPTVHRDVYPSVSPTNVDIRRVAEGKVVLVTGSGSGFGEVCIAAFYHQLAILTCKS